MIIKDEGFVLSAKKYGEKALIVTLLTKSKGKLSGYISDGTTPKLRGLFQTGNKLFFEASARLEENLHRLFRLELLEPNAVMMMSDIKRLEVMTAVIPMMQRLLNENEEVPLLYQTAANFFNSQSTKEMLTHYAFFEFYCLDYLGIGLSLDCCAMTGKTEDLAYVSPRSGKAVCKEIGLPYAERLFAYPHFIVDKNTSPTYEEIFNVLKMTEFFLKERFFKFHNIVEPKSRSLLIHYAEKEDTDAIAA